MAVTMTEPAQPVESHPMPAQPDAGSVVTRKHLPGLGSIQLRGRTWHCEFWKQGKYYRESTRTTNERKAIAHLRKRVEQLAHDRYVGPKAERITVAELLKLVTQDYATRGNRSTRTLRFRVAALTDE